ncbi:DUF2388 domain-containing protein [Pseudomonas taiwanensis]|uniref:DUF2388 domain-containing protein n=1 Tax=Pseudomonas taiwanensis TaxID=470150 RepID=UPI0028E06779|nr:DUF2388 domain-containing protein [Pseudomonas taiwanensis]MDT8924677.1 DUF2388 domain-containing protein [Pseudomonas taiwanensis]
MLPRTLRLGGKGFAVLSFWFAAHCHAEVDAAAAMLPSLMSSIPTGITVIGFIGSTDASGSSSNQSSMKTAMRDDAAFYVASQGVETRPALEQAFERYRDQYPTGRMQKLEIAVAILANDPWAESLY